MSKQHRNRKYPIVHKKQQQEEDTVLSLDMRVAVGIVAVAFIQGIVIGYIAGKK